MSRLNPEKLHIRFLPNTSTEEPIIPRRYTLTHSDRTGHLFLTIGPDYDQKQISGFYTRLLRDEVLAEWQNDENGYTLHVYCQMGMDLDGGSFEKPSFVANYL